MALPESRYESHVDGVTKIAAQTIDDLQDTAIVLHNAVRGKGYVRRDEFDGDALDTFRWSDTVTGSGSLTVIDDHAAGGFGALKHAVTATGITDIRSRYLPIGANDFWFHARVRKVNATLGNIIVGIHSLDAAEPAYFHCTSGGNWFSLIGATNTDLAVAISTTYQRLDIVRASGVVSVRINGVEVQSIAFATNIDEGFVLAACDVTGATNFEIRIDEISLSVDR